MCEFPHEASGISQIQPDGPAAVCLTLRLFVADRRGILTCQLGIWAFGLRFVDERGPRHFDRHRSWDRRVCGSEVRPRDLTILVENRNLMGYLCFKERVILISSKIASVRRICRTGC